MCALVSWLIVSSLGGYYNLSTNTPKNLMTRSVHPSAQPTVATLGMQWLVLIVITLGMIVSSIGLTSSHGVAVIAATHESVQSSSEDSHGHGHADQGIEFTVEDERSSGEQPHHGADHSHDTAHHLPLTWGAASPQLPIWEATVRPWIDMGQAYRLDRPPMA